jgi:serine/threonine-protein kinase
VLEPVGEGGMGVVYKAYDPELDRLVALKLMGARDAQNGGRDRLLREAQALAQLSHPNVIAVHDVGTVGDDVFIAMDLAEGATLTGWLAEQPRSQREIVDVFVAAGEGLAAAHRAGLVHRDYKPANVMIEGERVRVLDFGLARAANAPVSSETAAPVEVPASAVGDSGRHLLDSPLTCADTVIGTPRFMAPEQHMGQPVGPAADQFSFCVALHWALCGAFPFADEDLAFQTPRTQALNEKGVPRWLRQVIRRGLSFEPAARFPSMDALLGALRADPRAIWRRWSRTALLIFAVAAVASALVAGVKALEAHRSAVEQARLGRQFGEEAERIANLWRDSALQPLHDPRRATDAIRGRMDKLRARMSALGAVAAGPGHEALGRGYLALEADEEALHELEASYATGYRSAELAYALGVVHGWLYQRALADLPKTKDAKEDAERRAKLAHAHRDPALRYLREVGAHDDVAEAPEYVEGMIALYEQRFDDALALAKRAAERVLWPYQARTLEGDVHFMAGKERFLNGDLDGALVDYARAGEAYRSATLVARSGAAAYAGDCRRLVETTLIESERDRSPTATVELALTACSNAAVAGPNDAASLAAAAGAWNNLAEYQRRHGVDPTAAGRGAIKLGERALTIGPRQVRAHQVIADAWHLLARHDAVHGGDPRQLLEHAIASAREGLKIAPDAAGYLLVAGAYTSWGEYEQSHGIDPRGSIQAVIGNIKRALAESPKGRQAWDWLGIAEQNLGQWQTTHGLDPTEAYAAAAMAYTKGIELSPQLDNGHVNLCALQQTWGSYELDLGRDPRPRFALAEASCKEAIRIDGNYDGSHFYLGLTNSSLALWDLEHGADASEAIARSRVELERSLALNPGDPQTLMFLGESQGLEARWLEASGRDPKEAFARAEAVGRKALALAHGESPETLQILTELYRRHAEWLERRRAPVAATVREGLALGAATLARDPSQAVASVSMAALQLVEARVARGPADRAAAAKRARAALDQALATNANLKRECAPLYAEVERLSAP